MKFLFVGKTSVTLKLLMRIDWNRLERIEDKFVLVVVDPDFNFLEKILLSKIGKIRALIVLYSNKSLHSKKFIDKAEGVYYNEFAYKNERMLNLFIMEIERFISSYNEGILINHDTEKRQMLNEIDLLNLKLQEKLNAIHDIYSIGKIIASDLNLENALTMIIDYAINLIEGEVGAILLKKNNKLSFEIMWGITEEIFRYIKNAEGKNILDIVENIDEIFCIEDFQKSGYYIEGSKFFIKSIMIIPLKMNFEFLGAVILINKMDGSSFSSEDMELANGIATYASIAIHNAKLHKMEIEKKLMEKELAVASDIQMALLPKSFDNIQGLELVANYKPARAVGGDYYDVIPKENGKTAIVIGDVSNKGVPASLLMVSARSIMRAETHASDSTKVILESVNDLLCKDNFYEKNMFITVFFSMWDPESSKLYYSNGGHCWPIVVSKNGDLKYIENGGLVLGQFPDMPYEEDEITLESGDLVFFYTDGIIEERNKKKKFYGREKLEEFMKKNYNKDLDEIVSTLYNELDEFRGSSEQYDDSTIILIRKI